ncbi:hypothetical protein P691DRAFT_755585 [Macrolepiota fuliginosa MF-IS2]|uniref:Uncharacterized protein n=1 Tax=Macrolepiota fuliginosa MF-IS2 TaxID=1400762 RepID=A0A9P6C5U9_9AGAR|nr:hypothetical protein P691DRAFT_755585 [Macrolepiota fuliginosa MF-IS2]
MPTARSKKHQKADRHKRKANYPKVAGEAVTGILLAVNEDQPRLVRIPIQNMPAEDDIPPWKNLSKDPWYTNWPGQGTDWFVRTTPPWLPPTYKLPPGQYLHVIYDDNFMINGSALNRCIQRLTDGKAGHQWCGNVMAVRADLKCEHQFWDAKLEEDLPALKYHFLRYGVGAHASAPSGRQHAWTRWFFWLGSLLFLYLSYRLIKYAVGVLW